MMAAEGGKVVVSDINERAGIQTTEAIKDQGGVATFFAADVSKSDGVEKLMSFAAMTYGGLDALHNNQACTETNFTADAQIFELDESIWQKGIDINLKGVWLCSKHAGPLLSESEAGVIINASSIGGLVGYPIGSAYGPSKAGVVQLTRVMALELAPMGIRVNCYAPGNTDTPMVQRYFSTGDAEQADMIRQQLIGTHLIHRLQTPEEVAE
jgi:NAD(P)-dependent dehydrogenase (short-subunit alcohol dehydrogenase family)